MPINKNDLAANLQTNIDSLTTASGIEDFMSLTTSLNGVCDDYNNYIKLACDIPTLTANNSMLGSIVFVEELGIPLVAGCKSWLGLDGRTYRKDQPDSALFLWGVNTCGVIGDCTTICRSSPVREASSYFDWVDAGSGACHAAALRGNGTIWSWGTNTRGELGIGCTAAITEQRQECTYSSNWSQLSVGGCSTLAIKTDGSLWAWGCNSRGQLGVGDTNNKCVPTRETTSSTWSYVGGADDHTSAIKSDGSLWSWGWNDCGQLATNNKTCASSPVQEISSSSNWSTVRNGTSITTALKTDGSVWSWGANNSGQLGVNDIISKSSPVREISSSSDWCQLTSTGWSIHVIKTNGSVWGWGRNNLCGIVGDGTVINRSSPVQEVSSSTNWCCISSQKQHTSALKTDGSLWGWGYNPAGELGDNTAIFRSSPVQEITSSTDWLNVSESFGRNTVAIKSVI